MSEELLQQRPGLKAGCRWSPGEAREAVLLIPEGALRLRGPSRKILELCDGERCLQEVIDLLRVEFPTTDGSRIAQEVTALLTDLQERGAVEFL